MTVMGKVCMVKFSKISIGQKLKFKVDKRSELVFPQGLHSSVWALTPSCQDGFAQKDNSLGFTKSFSKKSVSWSIIQLLGLWFSVRPIGYWTFVYRHLERHLAKCRYIIRWSHFPGESGRQFNICPHFRIDGFGSFDLCSAWNQSFCFELPKVGQTNILTRFIFTNFNF